MKKIIRVIRDEDKHPIDEYLLDADGKYSCYSCICRQYAEKQHEKVDNDLKILDLAVCAASIFLYAHFHNFCLMIPFLLCLLSFAVNMVAGKNEERLYFKMSNCDYFEDTEVMFNTNWNKYGRWQNKVIWGTCILGVLSFCCITFMAF